MAAPKAFISHTSDDKDRWARPLAQKLNALGIDSWFDEWEIKPGDSIVQKVFTSGIEEADAFVVILSKTSVNAGWVKAELDVAVVRKIGKLMRLIPVKVDDCVVPTALVATRYLKIDTTHDLDSIATEIANTLLGATTAPPVGPVPEYVSNARVSLPGVAPFDALVLETLYDRHLDAGGLFADSRLVIEALAPDVRPEQVYESLEVLASQYLVDGRHKHHGIMDMVDFHPHSVLSIAGAKGENVAAMRCLFVAALLNSPNHQVPLDELLETSGLKRLHLWSVTKEFQNQDLIWHSQPLGKTMGTAIVKNEALLKRWTTAHCP